MSLKSSIPAENTFLTESCPPPSSYPGSSWDLFKAIRLFALRFGIITNIKAYWDGADSSSSAESTVRLRAAMPSMGIGLVDCSSVKEYNADALSRTLAGEFQAFTHDNSLTMTVSSVDLLISAIDNQVNINSTGNNAIIVISGDKSILHPITQLMLRGYTIYLVIPDELNDIEQSRASKVFRWHADVLSFDSDPSPEPMSISSRESPMPEGQGFQESGRSIQTAHARLGHRSVSSRSQMPASKPTSDMASYYPTSPKHHQSRDANPLSPQKHPTSIPALYSHEPNLFTPSVTSTMRPRTISRPIPVGSPGFRAHSATDFNRTTTTSSNSVPGGSLDNVRVQMMGQLTPLPAQEELPQEMDDDWAAKGNWNNKGGWGVAASSWLPEPERAESGPSQPGPKVDTFKPKSAIPKDFRQKQATPIPNPATVDSSVFIPLLQHLQRARTEGKTEVLRSVVGAVFAKDKSIYEAAGVSTFGGYITLAAEKGLVKLGGVGGKAWIAL